MNGPLRAFLFRLTSNETSIVSTVFRTYNSVFGATEVDSFLRPPIIIHKKKSSSSFTVHIGYPSDSRILVPKASGPSL